MWTLLDALVRPPLGQALVAQARAGDEACLRLLADVDSGSRRRSLRRNLRETRRLLAPLAQALEHRAPQTSWLAALVALARTPGEARALERVLDARDAARPCLGRRAERRLDALMQERARHAADLGQILPDDEAILHRGIARGLVRSSRRLARRPRGKRARRAVARQIDLLAFVGVTPEADGLLATMAGAAGRLAALLAEDAWLRTLVDGAGPRRAARRRVAALARRRRRQLHSHIRAEAQRAGAPEPARLVAELRWQLFAAAVVSVSGPTASGEGCRSAGAG